MEYPPKMQGNFCSWYYTHFSNVMTIICITLFIMSNISFSHPSRQVLPVLHLFPWVKAPSYLLLMFTYLAPPLQRCLTPDWTPGKMIDRSMEYLEISPERIS